MTYSKRSTFKARAIIALGVFSLLSSSPVFAEMTDKQQLAFLAKQGTQNAVQFGEVAASLRKCGHAADLPGIEKLVKRVLAGYTKYSGNNYWPVYQAAYRQELAAPGKPSAEVCPKLTPMFRKALDEFEPFIEASSDYERATKAAVADTTGQDKRMATDRLPVCTPDLPASVDCAR